MSNLWGVANEIDSLNCRVTNVKNIIEMVAEHISTDVESGALWAAADSLGDICDKMDLRISELMQINRIQNEKDSAVLEKKGKKKCLKI